MVTALVQAPVAWHQGTLVGFDLESTGIDVEQDRIVTASIVLIVPTREGPRTAVHNWLANPGVPIPDGAAAIHGVTTERAVADGRPAADVVAEVTDYLADVFTAEDPVVGMNIVYDLTLLDRECRRHSVKSLSERIGLPGPVVDVRVLDKTVDPYRRGGRKLTDLCAHYGVQLDNAHEATSDALGALRVAYRIAARYPAMQVDPRLLHEWQVTWAREQMASFAAYRRKTGQPLEDEDGSWPIRPRKDGAL